MIDRVICSPECSLTHNGKKLKAWKGNYKQGAQNETRASKKECQ